MDKPSIPRGLRNNNPLNIKRSPQVFQGESKFNTDPVFKKFCNVIMGYRAAFCILRTYVQLRGCETLQDVITRWCPDNEVLEAYVNFVSVRANVLPTDIVQLYNLQQMTDIVSAMSLFENGIPAVRLDVVQAYRLAFNNFDYV